MPPLPDIHRKNLRHRRPKGCLAALWNARNQMPKATHVGRTQGTHMNINKKIAEVLNMSDKATIGPWGEDATRGLIGGDGKQIGYGLADDETAWLHREEDVAFFTHARLDLPALAHAIDAVLELHVPQFTRSFDANGEPDQYCDHCNTEYPCPTLRALDKGSKRAAVYALRDFDQENGITE